MMLFGRFQNIESCCLSSEIREKIIGFYGGSFDPPHYGHLLLAKEMQKIHHLDEIWFCPANLNPHKAGRIPAPALMRLEMLNLAIDEIPSGKIIDIELKREGPSYTVDTLRTLTAEFSDVKFKLILGEDACSSFFKWKEPEEVIRLADPLVGARSSLIFPKDIPGSPKILEALKSGWTPIKFLEISSTEIRRRLKNGEDCSSLLPAKILDFILKNHLYSS